MPARVSVEIVDGPLAAAAPGPAPQQAGAVVVFEGIVRRLEDGRPIAGLNYESYEPMAQKMLRRLAEESAEHHRLLAVDVEHSRGFVAVGECSFRLRIASPHRQESLLAMTKFIDCLKTDVPIWKSAVYPEQS